MSSHRPIAEYFARTEKWYFLALLVLSFSLIAFNLHQLYKEWPSILLQIEAEEYQKFKEEYVNSIDLQCRKEEAQNICDLENEAYRDSDLSEDYRNIKAGKENAEKNFHTRLNIVRDMIYMTDKNVLLSVCTETYFTDMLELERLDMCNCYAEKGAPVFKDQYPIWVKALNTQNLKTIQAEIVKACTQILKN